MIQRLIGRLSVNNLPLEAVYILPFGLGFFAWHWRFNLCLFAFLIEMRIHGPAHICCVNQLLVHRIFDPSEEVYGCGRPAACLIGALTEDYGILVIHHLIEV